LRRAAVLFILFSIAVAFGTAPQSTKAVYGTILVPGTIVVPDDYGTIQDAVDSASSGDTVFVRSGTYIECVNINKSLSLIGENKADTIILGDWRLGGTVVLVCHDDIAIKGFTIQSIADNTHGVSVRGVHLLQVRGCIVSDCSFSRVGLGVWLYGSSENTIEDNFIDGQQRRPTVSINPNSGYTLLGGFDGIVLQDSSYNSILRNTLTDVYFSGMVLSKSLGNNLTGNYVNTDYVGVNIGLSDNNTIAGNKISANRFGIIQDCSSYNIIANNIIAESATGIQFNSSSCFNLVENNTITYGRYCGVEVHYNSNQNLLLGNRITDNNHGLELKLSSNNTLRENNITMNKVTGVILVESSKNLFCQNNFIANGLHVSNNFSVNTWDNDGKGNYWDNYTGTDADNDGLGESPYVIDTSNRDNYPLIMPHTTSPFSQLASTPESSSSPKPTAKSEPFLTTLVIGSVVGVVVVGLGWLVYFKKHER